jgi:RNA polymerase-binding protein DksA
VSTVENVDKYKQALLEERKRVTRAIEYMHRENPGSIEDETGQNTGGGDNHLAETATATVDREIDYSLEESSEELLGEIDAALKRIEDGTYGTCEGCGKPIGEDRLEAIPWTRFCIDDARKRGR